MRTIVGFCLVLLSGAVPLHAQDMALLARAGTGGFGGGVAVGVLPTVNVRVEGSYFAYSRDDLELEGDYTADILAEGQLMLASVLADWHPMGGGFRFSVGAMYNGTEGSGSISPDEPVQVGTRTYSPQEIGNLSATIRPGITIAPYGGIGFGSAIARRVGVLFDVGAVYLGAPEVDITATGMLAPTAQEAGQLEENLAWAKVYPLVSLGLSFRPF